MRRLLDNGLLDLKPGGSHCVIDALNTTIHQGAAVIALLTEHMQPSIPETWLTEVIKLLLTSSIAYLVTEDLHSLYQLMRGNGGEWEYGLESW